jgi:hypothetical protein
MSDQDTTPEGETPPEVDTDSLKSQLAALEAAGEDLSGPAKSVNANQQKDLKEQLGALLGDQLETLTETPEAPKPTPAPQAPLSPEDQYVQDKVKELPGDQIKRRSNAVFDSLHIQREAILYHREVEEANAKLTETVDAMEEGEEKDKALDTLPVASMTMQELARRTGYALEGAFRRRIRYMVDYGQIPAEPIDEAKVKRAPAPADDTQTESGTEAAQGATEGQDTPSADVAPQEGQEGSEEGQEGQGS